MKVWITLITVFFTALVLGDTPQVRPSWSGAWYHPDHSGHGISVEVLDDENTVFFWYTYDPDGNPIWLLAQGTNSEIALTGLFIPYIRVEATAYYHDGMIFGEFDPDTNHRQEWGTIILDFQYAGCDSAHMEWFPTIPGFTHGSTDLVRLTSLYELDCPEPQNIAGNWEVQFGYDAEVRYPVEIVATPNPDIPEMSDLVFEFLDATGCAWSGELFPGFGLIAAEWGNSCAGSSTDHSGGGEHFYEHELCDSENHCERKDEVMIFEDEGEFLIFSR